MKVCFSWTAALVFACVTSADIAPTTFTGTNILPARSTDVRMENADVHIVWGNPCSLTAEFTMVNESGSDFEVETGFPVGAYPSGMFEDEYDNKGGLRTLLEVADSSVITIAVNGTAVTAYRRLPVERLKELQWRYATWYFAKIVFRPGMNRVSVRTLLVPSEVSGQPYKRRVSYCISTGGRWKGAIGRETVEIEFPALDLRPILTLITPRDGRAIASKVQWDFHDIEPLGDEYDIDLEFLLPAVATKLAELKSAFEREPKNSKAALRYAVHLFCLGEAKANSGFPPDKLSREERESILARISEPGPKAVFTRFYLPQGDHFAAVGTEWTEDRRLMVQILADSGYSKNYAEDENVAKAKGIVEKCVSRDPRDAEAWNIYLTHFWRFSFAAKGHWFGPTVWSVPLAKAIETAHKNCPDDKRIYEWHQALQAKSEAPGNADDFFRNEFPKPDETGF